MRGEMKIYQFAENSLRWKYLDVIFLGIFRKKNIPMYGYCVAIILSKIYEYPFLLFFFAIMKFEKFENLGL